MTALKNLQDAADIHDLAAILGYKASAIAFLLYKTPPATKYTTFTIPKKSGGVRQIDAPNDQLKGLQRRLANVLYQCIKTMEHGGAKPGLSHAYRNGRSIVTNASVHKRRRFVLNIDLSDFFPSINFGRVYGFFIKSKAWSLQPKIATLIAQIACHNNTLPQGSPCSPIIADLVGGLLDSRLVRFSKKHQISYSRYADDLTFSTNKKEFPSTLAWREPTHGSSWQLGSDLLDIVARSGFMINASKTRMQCRPSRQLVTGLTVNLKVNVRADYYKRVRAQCHSVFQSGGFFEEVEASTDENGVLIPASTEPGSFAVLEGKLSHIHYVKDTIDRRDYTEKVQEKTKTAFRKLYHDFLFHKYFLRLTKPIIVPEGKTDNAYLSLAIRYLPAFQPKLGVMVDKKLERTISFFPMGGQAKDLMELGGSQLKFFLQRYKQTVERFAYHPMDEPVIVLVDNDDASAPIYSTINQTYKVSISHASSDSFFHLTDNLYLIRTPQIPGKIKTTIEDLFDPALLKTPLNGKAFASTVTDPATQYGKQVLVEKVVRPNASKIDWSLFTPLLQSISDVMDHHASRKSVS